MFRGSSQLAFHLVFDRFVEEPKLLSAHLMDLFEVRRLVFIKKSPKEKWLLKSAVLILEGSKSLALLRRSHLAACGITMQVHQLDLEEAEDLIEQKRTKVYVGNIPFPVDNLALWNYFSQFGKIDYSYILKKPVLRGAKGFGFVIYESRTSVERALAQKNILHGSKLNCKLFLNKAKLKKEHTASGAERGYTFESTGHPDYLVEEQEYQQMFGCQPADADEKVSKLSRESTDKCGSGGGLDHQDQDHCKDCCDECHEVDPANGEVSDGLPASNHYDQHVSKHLDDEEHELPEIIPGSQFRNLFSERNETDPAPAQTSLDKPQDPPLLKRRTLKEALQMRREKESKPVLEPSKPHAIEPASKSSRALCECRSSSCEKCWKDLIEDDDYNPPCDICICDLKSAGAIGQATSSLAKSKAMQAPLHQIDECQEKECEPCSSLYLHLKKSLKLSCCQYTLFNFTK